MIKYSPLLTFKIKQVCKFIRLGLELAEHFFVKFSLPNTILLPLNRTLKFFNNSVKVLILYNDSYVVAYILESRNKQFLIST